MSDFKVSVQDLFASDADQRIAKQISNGQRMSTSRMQQGDRTHPMGITMFNLAEILMKAPGYNSIDEVLTGQEGILGGIFGGIFGGDAKEQLPGLENFVPGDLIAMTEGTDIGASETPVGGGGGTGGAVDQGDPNASASSFPGLGNVQPHVRAAVEETGPRFGIKRYHGKFVRQMVGGKGLSYHSYGLAVDYMVAVNDAGKAKGDKLVAYHIANWDRLKVRGIIWYRRSKYGSKDASWKNYMTKPGRNPHIDHPHIVYHGPKII